MLIRKDGKPNRRIQAEELYEQLLKEEYQFLTHEYYDRKQKIELICPRGHQFLISWGSLIEGHRCKYCVWEDKNTSREVIEAELDKEGYRLLTEGPIVRPNTEKIKVLCPNGHEWELLWYQWTKLEHRCKECFLDKRRNSFEEIKEELQKEKYTLLTTEYKSVQDKMKARCPKGHIWEFNWNAWRTGYRCYECGRESSAEKNIKYTIKDAALSLKREGYVLLSENEAIKHHDKFDYICPKGHIGSMKWNNWYNGHRCGTCVHQQSKAELELIELFKDFNPQPKDRTMIAPKELDIYFPDHNVAIEYCGLYWHSTGAPGERMTSGYHRAKLDECKKKSIRLLTIFSDEWSDHKEVCLSRIRNALNIVATKVHARKCILKKITKEQAKRFLDRTHLQQYGACSVAFGLFFEDKLIQVMTFGNLTRAHTAAGRKVLELKRLASDLDIVVVGGASKLFKAGLKYAKQKGYEVIKSYCDLRWGTGNLYQQLGFTKVRETRPAVHYTDGYCRYRNQTFATNKKKEGTTEAEKVLNKGLWQIYDCGHQTWEIAI